MTINEITRRFPKASAAFIAANLDAQGADQAAELERDTGNAPLETEEVQGPDRRRILVRVTSIRKRLLDEDNMCEKYLVDLCRYAGIIPTDAPGQVSIETSQRKAKPDEAEGTVIEVTFADNVLVTKTV